MEGVEKMDRNEQFHSITKALISKGDFHFGPGMATLLQKIKEEGSIQAACGSMKLSYTKAWKMLNEAEKGLGVTFIHRKAGGNKGGFSELTEEGIAFLDAYSSYVNDIRNYADLQFEKQILPLIGKEN